MNPREPALTHNQDGSREGRQPHHREKTEALRGQSFSVPLLAIPSKGSSSLLLPLTQQPQPSASEGHPPNSGQEDQPSPLQFPLSSWRHPQKGCRRAGAEVLCREGQGASGQTPPTWQGPDIPEPNPQPGPGDVDRHQLLLSRHLPCPASSWSQAARMSPHITLLSQAPPPAQGCLQQDGPSLQDGQ